VNPVDMLCRRGVSLAACGTSFSVFVDANNVTVVCGFNRDGQLGLGTTAPRVVEQLTSVEYLADWDIVQVACGVAHVFYLRQNGEVYATGYNAYGQLGIGHDENVFRPQLVASMSPIGLAKSGQKQQVEFLACGAFFTYFATSVGDVWSTGKNQHGQLSLGHTNETNEEPLKVKALSGIGVAKMNCGAAFAWFVTRSQKVLSVGLNHVGQLGGEEGCVQGDLGPERHIAAEVPQLERRGANVACGSDFAWIWTADGAAYGVGGNEYGQLGLGDSEPRRTPTHVEQLAGKHVAQVGCSKHTAWAVTTDDEVFVTGANTQGELGWGSETMQHVLGSSTPHRVDALCGRQLVAVGSQGGQFAMFIPRLMQEARQRLREIQQTQRLKVEGATARCVNAQKNSRARIQEADERAAQVETSAAERIGAAEMRATMLEQQTQQQIRILEERRQQQQKEAQAEDARREWASRSAGANIATRCVMTLALP